MTPNVPVRHAVIIIIIIIIISARCVRRTNRRAIAMTFVRPSVCLGRVCIVIIRCTLARIPVYG